MVENFDKPQFENPPRKHTCSGSRPSEPPERQNFIVLMQCSISSTVTFVSRIDSRFRKDCNCRLDSFDLDEVTAGVSTDSVSFWNYCAKWVAMSCGLVFTVLLILIPLHVELFWFCLNYRVRRRE